MVITVSLYPQLRQRFVQFRQQRQQRKRQGLNTIREAAVASNQAFCKELSLLENSLLNISEKCSGFFFVEKVRDDVVELHSINGKVGKDLDTCLRYVFFASHKKTCRILREIKFHVEDEGLHFKQMRENLESEFEQVEAAREFLEFVKRKLIKEEEAGETPQYLLGHFATHMAILEEIEIRLKGKNYKRVLDRGLIRTLGRLLLDSGAFNFGEERVPPKELELAFDLLGIPPTSNPSEVSGAFKREMRKCHPDLHPDSQTAEDRAKELAQAFEIIKKDQK